MSFDLRIRRLEDWSGGETESAAMQRAAEELEAEIELMRIRKGLTHEQIQHMFAQVQAECAPPVADV